MTDDTNKKKILFVINTLGRAGAETAMMALLRKLLQGENAGKYDISVFVLTGQGEMISELPEEVHVLNRKYYNESVLSSAGRDILKKTCLRSLLRRCNIIRLFPYLVSNALSMRKTGFKADKLLWRVLSDGADRSDDHYDLAVAYLEGGSTYYTADHVNADKKAAFVHVDYVQAGYTRRLDRDCYGKIDRIFSVSDEVKDAFLKMYPEYASKADVFHNILDTGRIISMSEKGTGFTDGFNGMRIVTVGRLTSQKAFEVSIDAMKIIKEKNPGDVPIRWYVFGEGDQRPFLEECIRKYNLENDFILCGATDNPYPFIASADLYVHASRFEGKSIAIQEAQLLKKPIIASDCSGNREQIENGKDGILCNFNPDAIASSVLGLLYDETRKKEFGIAAFERISSVEDDTKKLMSLIME